MGRLRQRATAQDEAPAPRGAIKCESRYPRRQWSNPQVRNRNL